MMNANRKKPKARIVKTCVADNNNVVHTIEGGGEDYCRTPCLECPWRKDNTGKFPAQAFRISTNTAQDMSIHVFACHMRGAKHPATCAGFLLRGADDNLAVRTRRANGRMADVGDGGHELHESYKVMAVANGCYENDPALKRCMPEARTKLEYKKGK